MKIEIDQSGRVEYTSVLTAVGDSLGNSLILKASDKRALQQWYRLYGRPRIFAIEVFSIMNAYIIAKTYTPENIYMIDQEYVGKSDDIKRYILLSLHDLAIPIDKNQVDFALIGKKSKAHETAYNAYQLASANKVLNPRDILKLFHP